MIRISIIYLILILSSPFIVLFSKESFTIDGWLAIGNYNFDIIDGLYRSIYFYIITLPVIISLYIGRPKFTGQLNFILKRNFWFSEISIYLLLILYIIALIFNLGINGLETDTGVWKLSGIVYYFRSYISLIFISFYIFQKKKPSYLLIFLYSLIAGYTSASRFTAVTPLFLYLIRYILDLKGILNKFAYFQLFNIIIIYTIITTIRMVFYQDDYTFNKSIDFFKEYILDGENNVFYQGFTQLFLRIGIGRDVILSYEVSNNCSCQDAISLFTKAGPCNNPPLDFYGLHLDSNRFYLAPPQLSGLFVVSNIFYIQLIFSLFYAILTWMFTQIIKLIAIIPFGNILIFPLYFFIAIFVLIGPIMYAWYVCLFIICIWIIHKITLISFGHRIIP